MAAWERLQTIPGVRANSASVILSKCGADMSVFPSAAHLSSWAGVCPGNYQSGGKSLRASINRGNRWLRAALTQSAWAASVKKGCYLRDRFWRLAVGGKKRALVAVAHSLVTVIYQVLSTGVAYPGTGCPAGPGEPQAPLDPPPHPVLGASRHIREQRPGTGHTHRNAKLRKEPSPRIGHCQVRHMRRFSEQPSPISGQPGAGLLPALLDPSAHPDSAPSLHTPDP